MCESPDSQYSIRIINAQLRCLLMSFFAHFCALKFTLQHGSLKAWPVRTPWAKVILNFHRVPLFGNRWQRLTALCSSDNQVIIQMTDSFTEPG
jgi:hypothetical protein